jgi:hypothetical protein
MFQSPYKTESLFSNWFAEPWPAWERWGEVGEVGVQAHVLVLQRDLEQREDDQDEDEVD